MLKIFFWLLVAINGALFALGQSLLEKQPVQRNEPQRLAQQLHPEQLVLSPTPTVAAPVKPAAPAVTAMAIAQPATVAPTPTVTPASVPAVALPALAATTPTSTPILVPTPAAVPAPAAKPSPAPAPTAAPDVHLL